ncbi:A disintegrin and metalloproteinase with thrombospondin motifs 18 isoform X2 [Vespula maculifrons]|uniref:A disintegrin and metalloproteinase with thrombospondin motifs 18 isoform X2 n=1 Tax=Vespula maculifrons TaxID=7453 RepID=A0ABD2CTR4_VESMC
MHIPNHSVKREKMLRESDGGLGETDFFVKSFKGSSTMKRLFLLQIFIVVVNTTSETLRRQPSSGLRAFDISTRYFADLISIYRDSDIVWTTIDAVSPAANRHNFQVLSSLSSHLLPVRNCR